MQWIEGVSTWVLVDNPIFGSVIMTDVAHRTVWPLPYFWTFCMQTKKFYSFIFTEKSSKLAIIVLCNLFPTFNTKNPSCGELNEISRKGCHNIRSKMFFSAMIGIRLKSFWEFCINDLSPIPIITLQTQKPGKFGQKITESFFEVLFLHFFQCSSQN